MEPVGTKVAQCVCGSVRKAARAVTKIYDDALRPAGIRITQLGILGVAVRIGPQTEASLVVRRVGQVRLMLFGSPDYLARRGRPRTLQDLVAHDIVYDSHRPSPPIWRFRSSGRDRVIRLKPRLMMSDLEAVLFATKAGAGLGRALSYQVAGDLTSGALIRLLPEFEPAARPVQLAVPAARHMAPTVRAFMDHAAERLRALPVIHE